MTSIRAHYDGERVVLDEPAEIPANAELLVTVGSDALRADAYALAVQWLARAYTEEEPEYDLRDVKQNE